VHTVPDILKLPDPLRPSRETVIWFVALCRERKLLLKGRPPITCRNGGLRR
jgi:hypothetical protein